MNDMRPVERIVETDKPKIAARGCQVYYGETHAIKDVDVDIEDKTVTAFIGPSGCGKSTFSTTYIVPQSSSDEATEKSLHPTSAWSLHRWAILSVGEYIIWHVRIGSYVIKLRYWQLYSVPGFSSVLTDR